MTVAAGWERKIKNLRNLSLYRIASFAGHTDNAYPMMQVNYAMSECSKMHTRAMDETRCLQKKLKKCVLPIGICEKK